MDKTKAKNSQSDEEQFQAWIRSTPWFKEFKSEYKEEPDLNTRDYDYRAAWRAGIKPERDPYDNNRFHWPSSSPDGKMLKAPDHPTAWKEYFMRETGQNPDALGLRNQKQADQWLKLKKDPRSGRSTNRKTEGFKSGGKVGGSPSRGDGIAVRGKTKGRFV